MSSFIREVDESLREERALKAWRRWRWPVAGAVAAFLGSVGGWQGWLSYHSAREEASTLAYAEALAVSDDAYEAWVEAREEAAEAAAAAEAEAAETAAAEAAAEQVLAHLETEISVLGASADAAPAEAVAEAPDEAAAEEAADSTDPAADEAPEGEGIEESLAADEAEGSAAGADAGAAAAAFEPPDAALREELGLPVFHFEAEDLSALAALSESGSESPGVRLMSGMQLGWRAFVSGRVDRADEAWRRVIEDRGIPRIYRHYATLVWSQSMLDHLPASSVAGRLRPLADDRESPFWASATELLALAEMEQGNEFEARSRLEGLVGPESGAPPSASRRANALLSILDERAAAESLAAARAAAEEAAEEAAEADDGEDDGGEAADDAADPAPDGEGEGASEEDEP